MRSTVLIPWAERSNHIDVALAACVVVMQPCPIASMVYPRHATVRCPSARMFRSHKVARCSHKIRADDLRRMRRLRFGPGPIRRRPGRALSPPLDVHAEGAILFEDGNGHAVELRLCVLHSITCVIGIPRLCATARIPTVKTRAVVCRCVRNLRAYGRGPRRRRGMSQCASASHTACFRTRSVRAIVAMVIPLSTYM
jgi:hypothetical protein